MLRLFGGPMDGAEVEESEVVDGVFRAKVERVKWKPMAEEPMMYQAAFAQSDLETEIRATYRLEGGRLQYAWPPGSTPIHKSL